ncbi:MAG: GIY-YIG nuclease family protein [Thermoguttaceae bacterium]|jgi:hypothetical protein|nr:GIY-YIG nuclease family protein [Thermoguttaceae bacterium]
MVYFVVFVAGALAAASAVGIWYYAQIRLLAKQKHELRDVAQRLADEARRQHQYSAELENTRRQVDDTIGAFEARKVQYDDLRQENDGLKQDLFNLSVQLRKMERDHAALQRSQRELDQKANDVADRYLKENVSWIASKLTANNFANSKDRLIKVVDACRGIGFDVPAQREEELIGDLKKEFEELVRTQFAREEQARIRAQIREEERLAREIDKQIQDAERERAAIQAALEKTLAQVQDEHSAEVEALRAKLEEAEERTERAKSMAQLTKAGHVYVISNIGSFGEGVYKIGMTRRLEPMDRVRELGDASVPFAFDVHMMISCDDAPSLENAIHRELHKQRMNKVNFRKEFFRVDFDSIRKIVEANHGIVDYMAEPEAFEYRESLSMTEDDYEFIERTLEPFVGTDNSMTED